MFHVLRRWIRYSEETQLFPAYLTLLSPDAHTDTANSASGLAAQSVCLLLGEFRVHRAVPRVSFSQYPSSSLAMISAEKPQPKWVPIRAHLEKKIDYLSRYFMDVLYGEIVLPSGIALKCLQRNPSTGTSPNAEAGMHASLSLPSQILCFSFAIHHPEEF